LIEQKRNQLAELEIGAKKKMRGETNVAEQDAPAKLPQQAAKSAHHYGSWRGFSEIKPSLAFIKKGCAKARPLIQQ